MGKSGEEAKSSSPKRKKPQGVTALELFSNLEKRELDLELDALGLFDWRRHLQTRFCQRLDQCVFYVFSGGVSGGCEFTDEEEFGSFQHFLFAEGKRLGPA